MSTYRAFLSYSHRDARFARRFHADIEAWRVDADLIGSETLLGPVPPSLRPIFLDRDDFAGGGTLTDVTRQALSESAFLIVLCSPDAAQSHYVNEEVRCFKALGRADRIIPVIVAGEPGDPVAECFPDALTHQVNAEGVVLAETVEPLAADAREQGDGRRRALAKVIAGLLGIPFDEIAKRAERAQRRRTRILIAVAASMCVLAVAAAGFAWLSETRRVVAERNYHAALDAADSLLGNVGEELIRVEGIQLETTQRVIDRAISILDDLAESLPEAPELKISKVSALAVFAKALDAKGDHSGAIETYRKAETLAQALVDNSVDIELSRRLLAMVRSRLGMSLASAGQRDAAILQLEAAISGLGMENTEFAELPELQMEFANAAMFLSSLLASTGRLTDAATYGDKAIELYHKLVVGSPDDWRYRSLQSTAQSIQADLLSKQGDHEAALVLMLEVERTLGAELEARPDFFQIRGMVGSVQTSLAALHDKLGDTEAAEAARRRAASTTQYLAEADAENRTARWLHADNLAEQAETLAREGDITAAIAAFKESQDTLEAMAAEAPDDMNVRTSLGLSLSRAAGSFNDNQLFAPAEAAARRLLALREAALARAPDDPAAIRSVALALYQLGRAVEGTGALEQALEIYHRQLGLEQQLAEKGEDNRALRAEANHSIGLITWRLSRRAEAVPYYRRYVELLTELAAESPDDSGIRVDLGEGLLNLGELRAVLGNGAGALEAFRRSLEIRRVLVESDSDNPARLTDLAWAEARLAEFGDTPTKRWRRVETLLTKADALTPLGDWEEELLTVARIALSGAQH